MLFTAFALTLSLLAQTNTGVVLNAKAGALEAAGKYKEAGAAYHEVRDAFMKEENYDAAGKALTKVSEMLRKELAAAALAPKMDQSKKDALLPKAFELPLLAPQSGRIVGRVVDENGGAVPNFMVKYSGFEDGKVIVNNSENVGATVKGSEGDYSVRVPPGAYRVAVYVTYVYRDRTYNFEAEPLNPPTRHDFNSLRLDYLRDGLVRDFVLKMTGKKSDGWESSESGYLNAYYGGRLDLDCEHFGAGAGAPPPLYSTTGKNQYSPDSRLLVTLIPDGPMVDGSTGQTIEIDLRLGDNGSYKQCRRGGFPGAYAATAVLRTPTGETVPLRLSRKGTPDGKDKFSMEWKHSILVDFVPNDLGLRTPIGVRAFGLLPAK